MSCRAKHLALLQIPNAKRDVEWWRQLVRVIEKKKFFCIQGQHYYWAEIFRDELKDPPCPWAKTHNETHANNPSNH